MFLIDKKPGVNFINVQRAAFMGVGPKSGKKYSQIVSLFMILGSACLKASSKHVGEIDPWSQSYESNFILIKLNWS